MIEVQVTYDNSDYQRAISFMSRVQNRIYGAVLVIGGFFLGIFLYRANLDNFVWWVIPAILLMLFFVYGVTVLTGRWNIARQLKKIPDSHGPYDWTIDAEGLRIAGALSSTAIKWAAITKVLESKIYFFFYQAPRFARFLPKRTLTGEQLAELRRLIIEQAPGKAKLIGG